MALRPAGRIGLPRTRTVAFAMVSSGCTEAALGPGQATSAPGPHVRSGDCASPLPLLHQRCHIGIGTAPLIFSGLGPPPPLGRQHLFMGLPHPRHACIETGLHPAPSAPGVDPPRPHLRIYTRDGLAPSQLPLRCQAVAAETAVEVAAETGATTIEGPVI